MPTLINQKNGKVVIHTTANVNSNVSSFQLAGETLESLNISQVFWGSNGSVEIKRDTTSVLYLDGTGDMDFAGNGLVLSQNNTSNVVININGTGFSIVVLQKNVSANSSNY